MGKGMEKQARGDRGGDDMVERKKDKIYEIVKELA